MRFKCLFFATTFLLNFLSDSFAQAPMLLEHGEGVRTVEFSPVNSELVVSAGESSVIKLWNLQNNTVRILNGHTSRVNSVAFSPNGELLASVSDDRTIKLWNVRNQQNIRTLQDGISYRSIAFSPDGQVLATGGDRHVKLWDARRWSEITTFRHDQWVRAIAFSHDGQLLAAGDGSGEGPGTVKVWDVERRQVVVSLDANPKDVKAVEFSSDNRYLAGSGWNGHLKIWDVSSWKLLRTIPNIGHYDINFSPDSKMIAGTNNGYVNLYWVKDGARVARLPGPTGWLHPVDFSHDGASIAVGAEDGMIRIWRIDTSSIDSGTDGVVRILHVDTYLQQLSKANSAKKNNIPEPAPPPAIVRDFFELDPFYEQWINVGGLPVIASAKVSPYTLKEVAWLILKIIGHRLDVLRAMVGNKTRFSVMAYTENLTQIPEYSDHRPDFLWYQIRGEGGAALPEPAVTAGEENILQYPGETGGWKYSILIHELGHAMHLYGLNRVDPTFDNRLRRTYESAMKKGLWQGTYAASDIKEYWAEGTHAYFYPQGDGSFSRIKSKRQQTLKAYDPALYALLAEAYGKRNWQYTPVATRINLPHLQGFHPQDSPTFQWWPKLVALRRKFANPNSDPDGNWVDLEPHHPNQLSRLRSIKPLTDPTTVAFVNFTKVDALIYSVFPDGTQTYWTRARPGEIRITGSRIHQIYLIKDLKGKSLYVFRAEEKTGRALIGATPRATPEEQPSLTVDVNADGRVNKADLLRVVNALGKKATPKMRTDVNADGVVDVADLLLVIEHLDNPKDAAAPTNQEIMILLNPELLSGHLSVLHAQNDGSLKYQQAIGFLESLLGAAYPERTMLLANYPNPFNPETWVPYQLSKPAEVKLIIYAVNGNVVRRLALGHQPAGMYQSKSRAAYWDGRNEQGEAVASGVYFYTLSTGDFTTTRQMLIRK